MKEARAELTPVPLAVASVATTTKLADYVALTKPRLNLLVVATSAAGYYLGAVGAPELAPMAAAIAGTALVAGGAAVLNQVYERDTDRLMRRTRLRPLPDQRVTPVDARRFGLGLSAAGLAVLATRSSPLAVALALATLVTYLLVYTPLKRRSSLATLVGAVPGALPPLIGWAAARGSLSGGAWALFAIVFLWQMPHFMAIAWLYRDDYRKAGFPMLSVIEPEGRRTGRQALLYALALVPVSLAPGLIHVTGSLYLAVAGALGVGLVALASVFAVKRTDDAARALFLGSIIYLPLIWSVMIANRP